MSAHNWACVARLGGLGDNFVAASVCRPLKKLGYMVEVITSDKGYASIFRNNPHVDKIAMKAEGDMPKGPDWQKWFVNRAKEYDVFVHLSHSMEMRHALFEDSTAFWWPAEYRRKMCAGSYLETAHDIAGVPHDFGPLFFPTEQEDVLAEQVKEQIGPRFITWVIAGTRLDKTWPYAPAAIARIIKEVGAPVVLMGVGDRQKEMAERVKSEVKVTNSTRDMLHVAVPDAAPASGAEMWDIRPSLALVMKSDLVVTPDTGMAWAVAMEKMPKIVMVSHTSVENITKHWVNTTTLHADHNNVPCWPCHRLHNEMHTCTPAPDGIPAAACMADISVETVVENVARLWKRDNVVPLREAAE